MKKGLCDIFPLQAVSFILYFNSFHCVVSCYRATAAPHQSSSAVLSKGHLHFGSNQSQRLNVLCLLKTAFEDTAQTPINGQLAADVPKRPVQMCP